MASSYRPIIHEHHPHHLSPHELSGLYRRQLLSISAALISVIARYRVIALIARYRAIIQLSRLRQHMAAYSINAAHYAARSACVDYGGPAGYSGQPQWVSELRLMIPASCPPHADFLMPVPHEQMLIDDGIASRRVFHRRSGA